MLFNTLFKNNKNILIIAILAIIIVVVALYLIQQAVLKKYTEMEPIERGATIAEQEARRQELIDNKAKEISERAKNRSYTQEEIDFLLNPRGIMDSGSGESDGGQKSLTQEEVDAILNPN